MAIKFICTCGKHLKAREEMAGRRSACPACGAPVGIPLLRPTHRGATLGPMSPAELLRTRRCVPQPATPAPPAPPAAEAPAAPRAGVFRRLRLAIAFPRRLDVAGVLATAPEGADAKAADEPRWYHALAYTARAVPHLAVVGVVLAVLTGGLVLLIPAFVALQADPVVVRVVVLGCLAVPLAVLGYVCGFLDGALACGWAGVFRQVMWPGRDLRQAVHCLGRWLACFLAGPVLAAAGAFYYWLHCGDPGPLDWLILAELVVFGVGYGWYALLASHERGRWWHVHPLAVAATADRLGRRGAVLALAAAAVVVGHGLAVAAALDAIVRAPAAAWGGLAVSWLGALITGTFLLCMAGRWCRRVFLTT